ncbi:hypothetical protein PLANPX_6077 [Lacipirellula parvula]|uniref:Uncharacterized protein n=1 Tax=Lacipirellula parvula TaxID=2650471 RepID=A0A5K7XJA9_9BACT|nr:hypothetical protein PLANPX_6077 [Lacipirellula parvula]
MSEYGIVKSFASASLISVPLRMTDYVLRRWQRLSAMRP